MDHIEENHTELDLDAWLATGERTTHHVTLYGRTDLIAEIEELQAQIPVEAQEAPESEGSLGGGDEDPFADIRRQIEGLYERIDASKKTFRVNGLTELEIKALRQEVETKFADEIAKVAAQGRKEGKRTAENFDTKNASDVNQLVRLGATRAIDAFVERELAFAMVAKATKAKQGDQFVSLSVDTVRSLYEKLGETQVGRLSTAANKANSQAPKVTPGK